MQAQAARRTAPMKIGFRAGHDFESIGHLEVYFSIVSTSAYYIELAANTLVSGRLDSVKRCRQLQQNKFVVVRHIWPPASTARIIIIVHHQ